MIGYSTGELACGFVDGCITQEEALLLSYYQGRSYKEADACDGAIASVGLPWDDVASRCPPNVYPTGRNAKDNVTVAGKSDYVANFVQQLRSEGVHARAVQSHGISRHQGQPNEKLVHHMQTYFSKILKGKPKLRSGRWISSSVSAPKWDTAEAQSCPHYYVNNTQNPVLFHDALQYIPEEAVVVEIGLSPLLQPLLRRSILNTSIMSLVNKAGDNHAESFYKCLGQLYTLGLNVDISRMFKNSLAPFPMSSKAPALGQLVTWDHERSWSDYVITYPKAKDSFHGLQFHLPERLMQTLSCRS